MTDPTVLNPRLLMQDTNRRLFEWFANRVDARWTLRKMLDTSQENRGHAA